MRLLREVRGKPLHRIPFGLQRELDDSSVKKGHDEAWTQGTEGKKNRSIY